MDKKIRPKRQALGGFFMIPEISHSDISCIIKQITEECVEVEEEARTKEMTKDTR